MALDGCLCPALNGEVEPEPEVLNSARDLESVHAFTLWAMKKSIRIFAIFAVIVLLAAALQPAIAQPAESILSRATKPTSASLTPATASALSALGEMHAVANQQQNNKMDVYALQNATPAANRTDTDGDGLYDPVEAVLGTDMNDTDSDFDRLNDSEELFI